MIDLAHTDADWLFRPLVATGDSHVQSCLVQHLGRETPLPDAIVYQGRWEAAAYFDPVTWEERKHPATSTETQESWHDHFWRTVASFSPNTRVTAVECHY